MLRQLGLIAVCAWIVASVGCDGGKLTAPGPPPPPRPVADPNTTVTVEFGGRVVDADAGGPVGNVRVGRVPKRFKQTTNSDHADPIAANVLARDFAAAAPNHAVRV